MGACADALMLVLLDSNIYFSALISPLAHPRASFTLGEMAGFICSPAAADRRDSRGEPQPSSSAPCSNLHHVGDMLNHLYSATVWPDPVPRKYEAADPEDSYLLDLIEGGAAPTSRSPGTSVQDSSNWTTGSHQDSEGQYLLQ